MTHARTLLSIAAALVLAAPATAQVSGFAFVNNAGGAMSALAIRRVGSDEWRVLNVAAGAGANVRAMFDDPDCAFDLRASVTGAGQTMWTGVNLCGVKRLTLNRDSAGRSWVDYE